VATGGFEKRLRVFDLSSANSGSASSSPIDADKSAAGANVSSYEIGAGAHQGTIRSVVWGSDRHIMVSAAEDKVVRWWDLRAHERPISSFTLDGPLGTCELNHISSGATSSDPILSVAAGKTAYFFSGTRPNELVAKHKTNYDIASVAANIADGKFVTGGSGDTWVRVYDFEEGKEISVYKGHHGPVWSTSFSPDGKLCATGSEDGTIKLWKFTNGAYGLWK
jgi:serine-threonine kinase receptor-associated protein